MKVLYIAAECKPFSKAGGVGDVAGELPPALKKIGVDIEIATPLYSSVARDSVRPSSSIVPYTIEYDGNQEIVSVYEAKLGDVPVWLLQNPGYFEGRYGTPYVNSANVPFSDDIRRFAFFSKACLGLIRLRNPDIVHINDWVLGYLFGWMKIQKFPQRRVVTIHNIGYQGNIYEPNVRGWPIYEFALNPETREAFTDPHPGWNSFNALRMAMDLAHFANTVSPTYAKEMTEPEDQAHYFEGGKGLEKAAQRLQAEGHLIGILNGFEYRTDVSESTFDTIVLKKRDAKAALAMAFDEPDAFLLGFVGRAVEQKFKLLMETLDGRPVLEHLLNLRGVNIAILATGLPEYESFIRSVRTSRRNYSHVVRFDRSMAETISLGADVFLMPSLFEPCGITQMESMSTATPPLVRATGGLADTVIPHDQTGGTGFVFDGISRDDVLRNLVRSVSVARDVWTTRPGLFRDLQRAAFKQRFSWEHAARTYREKVYAPLIREGDVR